MSKNANTLQDFTAFCEAHPQLRFWQALCAWAGAAFIFVGSGDVSAQASRIGLRDTFYREGRDA